MNDKPDAVTEQELAVRSTAPRVTEAEVLGSIVKKDFYVHADGTLTICVLTLANGFTVTGESACADIKNYKQDIGERIAYDNAVKKIWAFLGYMLRDKLHNAPKDFNERLTRERDELRDRLTKLIDFIDNNPMFPELTEKVRHLMIDQRDHMQRYLSVLALRIEILNN